MHKNCKIKTVGIIGCDIFASNLIIEGRKQNYNFVVFDKKINSNILKISEFFCGDFNNINDILSFYDKCDVVIINTLKINYKNYSLPEIKQKTLQNPYVFYFSKNKLVQRKLFSYLNIKTIPTIHVQDFSTYLLNKKLYNYPLVFKSNNFYSNSLDFDWVQNFNSTNEIKKLEIFFKKYRSKKVIFENYVKWIGEFTLSCLRTKSNKNYVCSYNWAVYQNNGLFIVQPNYVKKKILFDSQKIMDKLLNHLNSPGIYTLKFYVTAKDELILNYFLPTFHISGEQTLFNYSHSQYKYLFDILEQKPILENKKIKNYALMLIIDKGYNQKNIKKLLSERKIKFYDTHTSYSNIKKYIIYGYFFLPRNPNNSYIMRHWVNLFSKNYKPTI